MEYRIERSNSDSVRIKVIRLQTPGARKSQFSRIESVPEPRRGDLIEPVRHDSSPAARAYRARRRLRRHFEKARRAARGQVRLRRADQHEMLRIAYAAVRCWQQDGVAEEIERELRAGAKVAMSRASSLFMVLIRSALPGLSPKRASKWGAALQLADHQEVCSKHLRAFLHVSGGIEGAARGRTKLRIKERSRAPSEDAAQD